MTIDCLLLLAPQLLPMMPAAGGAYLVAALRREGFDAHVEDLNAELYDFLLSARALGTLARFAEQAGAEGSSPTDEMRELAARYRVAGLAVGPAKAQLKRPDTYADPRRLVDAVAALDHALQLASAVESPGHIALMHGAVGDDGPAALARRARGHESVVVELLRHRVAAALQACPARVVAISSFANPAFALLVGALVKAEDPERFVVLGGPGPTSTRALIAAEPGYFDLVDAVVTFDGGATLPALLRELGETPAKARVDLAALPNVMFRDASGAVAWGPTRPSALAEAAPPDFGDLELSRYLSPGPALPVEIGRACPWHRCAFCNRDSLDAGQRALGVKRAARAVDEIEALVRTHGTRHVLITDDAVPATTLLALADEISRRRLDVRWMALARFEEPLADRAALSALRRGGCAKLCVALESAVPRVLQAMSKGIRVATVERVIEAADAVDLPLHLWTQLGFPTERYDEAQKTRAFVERLLPRLDRPGFSFQASAFGLYRNAPVDRDGGRYGISERRLASARLDPMYASFRCESHQHWPESPAELAARFAADVADRLSIPALFTTSDAIGALAGMFCATA